MAKDIFINIFVNVNLKLLSVMNNIMCIVIQRFCKVIVPSRFLGSVWETRSLLWLQEQNRINYQWGTGEPLQLVSQPI